MKKSHQVKTRDLYTAAFLYAAVGNLFSGLEEDGHDVIFVFEGEQAEQLSQQYYSRIATVNAKEYADAIRTCKDMIFGRLRSRGL